MKQISKTHSLITFHWKKDLQLMVLKMCRLFSKPMFKKFVLEQT